MFQFIRTELTNMQVQSIYQSLNIRFFQRFLNDAGYIMLNCPHIGTKLKQNSFKTVLKVFYLQ